MLRAIGRTLYFTFIVIAGLATAAIGISYYTLHRFQETGVAEPVVGELFGLGIDPSYEERVVDLSRQSETWRQCVGSVLLDLRRDGDTDKTSITACNAVLSTAVKTFDRALAFNGRGLAFYRLGEYQRAIDDFTAALRLAPNYSSAVRNRGRAYLAIGNYELSLADYARGTAMARQHPHTASTFEPDAWIAEESERARLAQETAPATGRRVALVMGNSNYANASRLPNAMNDAYDVSKALKRLGYEVFGAPGKADFTKSMIESELRDFEKATTGADAAIVWYAGHGQPMRAELSEFAEDWIIPVDAIIQHPEDVRRNAIRVDRLVNSVLRAKRLRLVVVDACRATPFPSGTRGLDPVRVSRPSVMIVYSASPGQLAKDQLRDGDRNSPFAAAFLETVRANPSQDVQKLFDGVVGRISSLTQGDQIPQPIGGMGTGKATSLIDQGPN